MCTILASRLAAEIRQAYWLAAASRGM